MPVGRKLRKDPSSIVVGTHYAQKWADAGLPQFVRVGEPFGQRVHHVDNRRIVTNGISDFRK